MKRFLRAVTEDSISELLDKLAHWWSWRRAIAAAKREREHDAPPRPLPLAPPEAAAPIAAPEWRRPSEVQLDAARGNCSMWNSPHVKICRGPAKGCPLDRDQASCPDCFLVAWYDRRSSAELLQAMERGDA